MAEDQEYHDYIDLTPTPRILIMLSHNPLSPLDALCELIDNSIDAFDSAQKYKGIPIENPSIFIDIPSKKDINSQIGVLRIRDTGPGMTKDEAEKALRAGYSSNNSYDSLGLFGMGFNISTSKMGRKTRVVTARKQDDFATEVIIDLEKLVSQDNYRVLPERIPKMPNFESGTIVEVSDWWPEGNPNSGFIKKLIGYGVNKICEQLGRRYATLLKEEDPLKKIRIHVNDVLCQPFYHCVWDSKRYVEKNGKQIPARFDFNEVLGTKRRCANCRAILMDSEVECPSCHSRNIKTIEERVVGWVGIQRFDDQTKFGIDLIRNGRCIRVAEKSAFFEFTDDLKNTIKDYPIDPPAGYGRIVGEVQMDFVPVDYAKQDFQRSSEEWAKAIKFLRGESSLQPKQPGADKNESPVYKLFQGYRNVRIPGKTSLYMGVWREGKDTPERIGRDVEKDYYQRFLNKEKGYFDDAEWWKLVEDASKKPIQAMETCPECGAQNLKETEICTCCGHILRSKSCPHCNATIPASAKSCPECGESTEPKVTVPWVCNICGTSNPADNTVCSKCKCEKDAVNPLDPEYLRTESVMNERLSVSKLSITLPDGHETDKIDLNVSFTKKPILSPITGNKIPLIVDKNVTKMDIFVDSEHPVFKNYSVSVEEFVASEVASFLFSLNASHIGKELTVSNLSWMLLSKYWSGNIEISQTNISEKCHSLITIIVERLMSSMDPSDAAELSKEMTVPQQKAFADNLFANGGTLDQVSELKSNGGYLQYVPPEFLLDIFDRAPEEFFNGEVWFDSYNDFTIDLDEEILKQTYERKRHEYRNSLETIVLYSRYPSSDSLSLQKVESALRYLENKIGEN